VDHFLRSPSPFHERARAIRALETQPDPSVHVILERELKSQDLPVRTVAAQTLLLRSRWDRMAHDWLQSVRRDPTALDIHQLLESSKSHNVQESNPSF
jgi:hypothetical protein